MSADDENNIECVVCPKCGKPCHKEGTRTYIKYGTRQMWLCNGGHRFRGKEI